MMYGSVGDLGSSVLLSDGWRLVLELQVTKVYHSKHQKLLSSIDAKYLKPMNSYIPTVDEIEVPYEFNY